ncbi:type III-B CRISPR module RAMP protein Cmr6 [Actinomadura sp. NPDC023710]|uniref:type III-B CRISPR module RAMP protein Cmr6 n=1 Tax=Actinomadura sp. NPDC023710 TaxID=3158219 RepID=UPI0033E0BF52
MAEVVAGPLRQRFEVGKGEHDRLELLPRTGRGRTLGTANARLVLLRTAVLGGDGSDTLDDRPIRHWALATSLGQHPPGDPRALRSLEAVQRRRGAAVRALARAAGLHVRTVGLQAQGAMITGTGDAGIRNVGITLHGTYGWPMIPGTTLKGVACAFARDVSGWDEAELVHLFGGPRPGRKGEAVQGAVTVLDALPGPDGVTVTEHVLTPHARAYRAPGDHPPAAPAEHLNPVPIPFLVVEAGTFVTHLTGPEPDVEQMSALLAEAVDEIGVGAKTSAGYGYMDAEVQVP